MIINHKAQVLVKHGLNYVTLTPHVLEDIRDPIACSIWCYLQSQSAGWIIRRTDIMNRWSLGRTRYDKAMKELRSLGLVWDVYEREGGKITNRYMVCSNLPESAEKGLRPENVHLSDVQTLKAGKRTINKTPQDGEPDQLSNNQLTNKLSNIYKLKYILAMGLDLPFEVVQVIQDETGIPFDFILVESWPNFLGKHLGQTMTGKQLTGNFMSWVNRHWNEFGGMESQAKKTAN